MSGANQAKEQYLSCDYRSLNDPRDVRMNPLFSIPPFIVSLAMVTMGAVFLLKNPRVRLHQLFACCAGSLALWTFGYGLMYATTDPVKGLQMARLGYLGVVFIPTFFVHFVLEFLGLKRPKVLVSVYILSFVFLVLSRFDFFLAKVHAYFWGFYPIAGPAYMYFVFFFYACCGACVYFLLRTYQELKKAGSSNLKMNQVKYVLFAFFIASLSLSDYLPNYYVEVYPFAYLVAFGWLVFIAYATFRYRVMDINVVIRKTLLYSVMSAGLASIYAGGVTLLARLLDHPSETPLGSLVSVTFRWFGGHLKSSFSYYCMATSLLSIGLGIFVLLKGKRKAVNILWSLTCFSIALWSLGLGMIVRAGSFSSALTWSSVLYAGAIMISIVFSHFALAVLKLRMQRIVLGGYLLALFLEVANAFGYLTTVKAHPPFNYYSVPLKIYPIYVVYFFFYFLYSHWLLFRGMQGAPDNIKNQIKYILAGTAVGYLGGATTYFMVYEINIFPYGVYVVPAYIFTVSYAIFKHQLMDINMVIRKTLLYSLVSAVLAAIYVGTITLLAQILGGRNGSVSAASSAMAAIFITLLFNPLRIRTQRWVDRFFPRERLDPTLLQEAAGGFAHEMKRPLSKISLPAQLMLLELKRVKSGERSWEDYLPALEEKLEFIVSQSADAGYMIEAVRELSSSAAVPFVPVNLSDVINTALTAEKDLLERRGVSVHVDLSDHLPTVSGRAKQLEIVFVNLIKNAAEAMTDTPEPHKLDITAKSEGGSVVIRVKDTGPGIKQDEILNIFHPHYTTKGAHGTGMGLYLSEQIVLAHGGTIDVRSKIQTWTEFLVSLPCRKFHRDDALSRHNT
jgi:signal transduction histidine kinase